MNFIILAAGRSGSTLLVNCLSSQPNVRCHHEPFNQNGWHKELRPFNNPVQALNHLDSYGLSIPTYKKISSIIQKKLRVHRGSLVIDPFKRKDNIKAEGFKITWAQADMMFGDMSKWLSNKDDMKCIFLYRYDYLARYVSYQLAHANGLWNSSYKTHNSEPFKVSKILFKIFCDKEILLEQKLWDMLTASNVQLSLLSYEDFVKNPLENVNTELGFLDCGSLEFLEPVTTKLVMSPLNELVINFNDLQSKKTNELAHEKRLERLKATSFN